MILLMQRALPTDKRGLFIGIDVKIGFTTGMCFPTCFDSSCVKMVPLSRWTSCYYSILMIVYDITDAKSSPN